MKDRDPTSLSASSSVQVEKLCVMWLRKVRGQQTLWRWVVFCQHRRCPRWRKCGFWRVNESNKLHAERVERLGGVGACASLHRQSCGASVVSVVVQQYLIRRPGFKFKRGRFCRVGPGKETVWPFEILPFSARHSTVLPGIPAIMLNQLSMATCEGYCSHVEHCAQRCGSSVTGVPSRRSCPS